MKKRDLAPSLTSELNELMPQLISIWRRTMRLSGPHDCLQTREFRSVVAKIKEYEEHQAKTGHLGTLEAFKESENLVSYLLYYFPLHFQEAFSLLQELPSPKKRVLDLCSGPGSYAYAALKLGAQEVTVADYHESALRIAGELAGKAGYSLNVRRMDVHKRNWPFEGKYDLIILAHGLEELFPSKEGNFEEQTSFFNKLFQHLSEDGHLLLVDNSLKETNARILELRNYFVKQGYPIQAPCLYQGDCPALKSKAPCYAQRELESPYLIDEIHRSGKIKRNSLKMSYLLIRGNKQNWPKTAEKPLFRVISPPIETQNGSRFFLCGKQGKKRLGTLLKKHPKESRAYEYLKRGEVIQIQDPLIRGDDLLVQQTTKLEVYTPLGKALKEVYEEEN